MNAALTLFLAFTKIGLLSIGGGYAIIPLIHERVVEQAAWVSEQVFADIITISQMTPGPLAVNTSTFVGLWIGGVPGALAATLGAVLGGVILSLLLYRFFEKYRFSAYVNSMLEGLKSASQGLIVSAAVTILLLAFYGSGSPGLHNLLSGLNWAALLIFSASMLALRKWRLNPLLIILLSGLAGVVVYT